MTQNSFQIRMCEELKVWLDKEAEKSGRSRSWLIQEACRQRMKRIERQRQQAASRRKPGKGR